MESQEYNKRTQELFAELEKYPENSKEYREIVTAIVKNNEGLVKYAAKRFSPMLKSTTLNSDDLISDGYLGLLKAIKGYKEKGATFATFAMYYIKGYMLNHLSRETRHLTDSLEDDNDGDKQNLKDNLVSPINMEEDFAEKEETDQKMAWVRKNLDQLPPLQKRILIARYLSGETMMKTQEALAEEFGCTRSTIAVATSRAIKKLREIYGEFHPEEIEIKEEKIKLKEVLKNLIATELAPMSKKAMLCRFYSPTPKTNGQVAEEIGTTSPTVEVLVSQSCKKLCTLCGSIKDTKHLKNILEFRVAESGKEY